MASKSSDVNPRNINPMAPELSDEARKAMKAVFDAMSSWQTDVVNNNEKNLDRVIDKIASAAEALGWPEEIGETIRAQMHAVTKMQTQTLDHMISAWEEQMNSPSSPSTILAKLNQCLLYQSVVGLARRRRKWEIHSKPICRSRNSGKSCGRTRWLHG